MQLRLENWHLITIVAVAIFIYLFAASQPVEGYHNLRWRWRWPVSYLRYPRDYMTYSSGGIIYPSSWYNYFRYPYYLYDRRYYY